jgi:hypothetical protein
LVLVVAESAGVGETSKEVSESVTSMWFIVDANQTQLQEITGMGQKGLYKFSADSVFALTGSLQETRRRHAMSCHVPQSRAGPVVTGRHKIISLY